LFELFNVPKDPAFRKIFQSVVNEKTINTWYFHRDQDGVHIKDISALDAGSDNHEMSNWGGLSEFSGRAVDIISNIASHA
jgi:hypothetical protein